VPDGCEEDRFTRRRCWFPACEVFAQEQYTTGYVAVAGYLSHHDVGGVADGSPPSAAAIVTIVNKEHLAVCSSPE
jgi:hypothetical protein